MLTNLEVPVVIEDYEKRNDRFSLAICFLGALFLFIFSLKSFLSGLYAYSASLAAFAILASLVMYFFLKTENRKLFQFGICLGFTVVYMFLLYTGGENDTAILWCYTYPLIVFTLVGAKRGVWVVLAVYLISVSLLFLPDLVSLQAHYTPDTKFRFAGSMFFVSALGFLMERSRVKAQRSSNRSNMLLKTMATRDELTGLYNRRAIRNVFERSVDTATTLAICDVDHFKKINDQYGHDVGDLVLKQVALSIQHRLRDTDVVVRWGGEEFLILLPNTELKEGLNIIERMRYELSSSLFEVKGHSLSLSISAGVVSSAEQDTWDEMISVADQYLYRAKKSGRNCSYAKIDDSTLV